MLQALKLIDGHMEIRENLTAADNILLQRTCCKRAFIRGAFLSTGSMSDPNKSYHFEIVCSSRRQKPGRFRSSSDSFDMDAKIVCRKRYFVVYLKEGAQIVDLLNVMEAHVALMDLENVRILKEMRNSVNRKVNCETANIHKTVSAAVKQTEDIEIPEGSRRVFGPVGGTPGDGGSSPGKSGGIFKGTGAYAQPTHWKIWSQP